MIRALTHLFTKPNPQAIAQERLAKLVEKTRQSYEVEQYRRKREAALKGHSA